MQIVSSAQEVPQVKSDRLKNARPQKYLIHDLPPRSIVGRSVCYFDRFSGFYFDRFSGFTLNQWRSVTLYLANLHAWSLTTDVEWRSKLPGPDQVADLFACYVDIVRKGLKPTIEKYSDYYGHMAESIYEK
uniref:Uncharacterized protein n=1 Tax=Romanomermis culicivorax TaxID=13658 RepID=A0A915J060_ROMCU